MHNGAGDR
ncbi:hypothetical protein YPPY02_0361, partial [Yersinia pestis PY-02]